MGRDGLQGDAIQPGIQHWSFKDIEREIQQLSSDPTGELASKRPKTGRLEMAGASAPDATMMESGKREVTPVEVGSGGGARASPQTNGSKNFTDLRVNLDRLAAKPDFIETGSSFSSSSSPRRASEDSGYLSGLAQDRPVGISERGDFKSPRSAFSALSDSGSISA